MKYRSAGSSLRPAVEAARVQARTVNGMARRPAATPAPKPTPAPVVTAAPPPTARVGNWELRQDTLTGALIAVWVPTGVTRVLALPPVIK